jgi:hypothetical protein
MIAGALGPPAQAILTDAQAVLVGDDPAIAGDERVLEFYHYWLALRGERRFPARRDIEPTDIPHLLAGILMLDVHYEPLDFEYRLIGGDIVARSGLLKGKRVREAALRNPASTAYENYSAAAAPPSTCRAARSPSPASTARSRPTALSSTR